MPKTDIDYSNTIIYKITCKNKDITDVYVGHTTNFVQRKHAHKQSCINNTTSNYKCKLYEVIRANGGWDNWKMEIINFFDCADHYDARKREQEYFISLNATLNSIEPFPKQKVILEKPILKNPIENITIIPAVTDAEGCAEDAKKFTCECCDYFTSRKSSIDKHLLSAKHAKRTQLNATEHANNEKQKTQCKYCSKPYKARNSLWYHEQKCKLKDVSSPQLNHENKLIADLLIELLKGNQDFHKQIMDMAKEKINNNNL